MILGYRGNDQMMNMLKVSSSDNGKIFSGQMQYVGEGPIGFEGEIQK